jgi:hypothetical protein
MQELVTSVVIYGIICQMILIPIQVLQKVVKKEKEKGLYCNDITVAVFSILGFLFLIPWCYFAWKWVSNTYQLFVAYF